MSEHDPNPALDDGAAVSVDDVLTELRRWREESLEAVASLEACRREVEAGSRQLESPQAAFEYIDFFVAFLGRADAEIDRVVSELPQGLSAAHLDTLRQMASNAALEQRRCLMFRDKWVNRPLPYEEMRPLLNRLSNESRDQLSHCRELAVAASRLEVLAGPPRAPEPPPARTMGRRALFNRIFKK